MSWKANVAHGLPLTLADRKAAAARMLRGAGDLLLGFAPALSRFQRPDPAVAADQVAGHGHYDLGYADALCCMAEKVVERA